MTKYDSAIGAINDGISAMEGNVTDHDLRVLVVRLVANCSYILGRAEVLDEYFERKDNERFYQ